MAQECTCGMPLAMRGTQACNSSPLHSGCSATMNSSFSLLGKGTESCLLTPFLPEVAWGYAFTDHLIFMYKDQLSEHHEHYRSNTMAIANHHEYLVVSFPEGNY